MKNMFLSCAALAALAWSAAAGEARWDGKLENWQFTSKLEDQRFEVKDGALIASGRNGEEKYSYLNFALAVKPFSLEGKSIALEVRVENPLPGDSFYLKCRTAGGTYAASFYTFVKLDKPTRLVLTPGREDGKVKILAADLKAAPNAPVNQLQFFFGRKAANTEMRIAIRSLELIDRRPEPVATGFTDYGVGIASAELRNCVAALDRQGRPFVLAAPLDTGRSYLLLTDIESGKTAQYHVPAGAAGAVYGGALTADGKFVYGLGRALIFDVNTRRFTDAGAAPGATLSAAIAPDGTVYLGGTPDARLTAVDPARGTARDCGKMDPAEHYLSSLAVDRENYLYAGIGTARANLVALNPATGEKIQLLPEALRKVGTGRVQKLADGTVFVSFGNFRARCLGGKVIEENPAAMTFADDRILHYGSRRYDFGNGKAIERYDLVKREITLRNDDGSLRVIPVEYVSGGLNLTSLAAGPDGQIYFSSAHPHHLGRLNPADGKITDLGYNPVVSGGNFCNMTAANGKLYSCEYAGGRMWEYDPAKPVRFAAAPEVENFGLPFNQLLTRAGAAGGRWSELASRRLLLGIGESDDNRLTLNLPVPQKGTYYLNFQFLESGAYGVVTVKAGGKELVRDLRRAQERLTPCFSLGPFELAEGDFPVVFAVASGNGGKLLFSLTGIELAPAPRPAKPAEAAAGSDNPRILGQWPDIATRPRAIAVHPNGREIAMSGFANYGLVGGGLAIHDLAAGTNRQLDEILPGESCIAMRFLPDGDLVGGTSIEAPGGGHTTAKAASVFRLDWANGKISRSLKLEGFTNVVAIAVRDGKLVAAGDGKLAVIDLGSFKLDKEYDIGSGGAVVRNGLQPTPDGRLLLLQNGQISELAPGSFEPVALATPPRPITGGGAVAGSKLYFIQQSSRPGSWDLNSSKK